MTDMVLMIERAYQMGQEMELLRKRQDRLLELIQLALQLRLEHGGYLAVSDTVEILRQAGLQEQSPAHSGDATGHT
jgi:hypothetical protein